MITKQYPPLPLHTRLLLQLRRIHAGWSVEEAAQRCGCSTNDWKSVEVGDLGPDEEMLQRMAEIVDLEVVVVAGIPILIRR